MCARLLKRLMSQGSSCEPCPESGALLILAGLVAVAGIGLVLIAANALRLHTHRPH